MSATETEETTEETTEPVEQPDEEETTEEMVEDAELEDAEQVEEPEPEQPQDEGRTVEWWYAANEKSDKENARHSKRVQEIYETESELFEQCPMCLGGPAGWLPPGPIMEDYAVLAKAKLGMVDPSEYEPMPGAVECSTCKGKGKVKTPSKVSGYELLMCPDCRQTDAAGTAIATGWKYVSGPNQSVPAQYATVPVQPSDLVGGQVADAAAPAQAGPPEPLPFDAWSRPLGHPHYGIPPADVGV